MAGATTTIEEQTHSRAEPAPPPTKAPAPVLTEARTQQRVEPKPLGREGVMRESGLEVLASQAFLSPRVVDGRTFEELSGLLRELVTEAVRSGRSLAVASDQAARSVEQLRALASAASSQVAVHVEAAGKALPAIDQRVRAAKELLDRVTAETIALRGRGAAAPEQARQEPRRQDQVAQDEAAQASARDQWLRDALQRVREEAREEAGREARALVQPLLDAALAAQREESQALRSEVEQLRAEVARLREAGEARRADEDAAAAREAQARDAESLARSEALAQADAQTRALIDAARRASEEAEQTLRRVTMDHARSVEACASEVVEQLSALRQDAARIVQQARADLAARPGTPADGAGERGTHAERAAEATLRAVREAQREALSLLDERLERAQDRLEEVVASGVLRVRRAQPERRAPDLEKADSAAEELSELIAKAQRAGAVLHEHAARMGERVEGAAFAMDRIEERMAQIDELLSQVAQQQATQGPAPDTEHLHRVGAELEAVLGEAYGVGEWLRQLLECAQETGPRLSEQLSGARTTIAALRTASLAAHASLGSAARARPTGSPPALGASGAPGPSGAASRPSTWPAPRVGLGKPPTSPTFPTSPTTSAGPAAPARPMPGFGTTPPPAPGSMPQAPTP